MSFITNHPINNRWPASDTSKLQLYSFPTPNGVKVSIALEEMGIPYEPHLVTLSDSDVKSPEFLALNPNNKIPAIIDPETETALFESGAILLYLSEKSEKFGGNTPTEKARITQWLMFQMGGLGPMFGQLGYFSKFAGAQIEDPRPRQRYVDEGKRLLAVLEAELSTRDWIAEEYSIADMAIAPWLRALDFYGVKGTLGWDNHPALIAYLERFLARPAVQVGLNVPDRDG
ncbi:glutathione S-transferase family protein [Thalassobacter stenotrophicus]|uniref:glutathione S-transferase family protein n=1 Tax=Thalassobacter stenotrophicus TaxID=266809 RepID=UPI0022A97021|nr:glutathione S-transferase family protein [Thalassobacter stenotrophicus]UYP67114.1 glutathione S-transferase family protein [Thalassobacter stenotrophicus]